MHYWLEVMRESGKSHVFTTGEEKNINAWAADVGISYDWDVYSQPYFDFEYAFGSGDSDRNDVTDTKNGNTAGQDKNFLYFGYLPTGYALAPRLSNLQFYKVGTVLKPFEKHDWLKKITVGLDYFQFYKDKKTDGISDLDATEDKRDIGWEINAHLSWQILSDVEVRFEYGYFLPGPAFPETADDVGTHFSVDMTITY